MDRRRHDLLQLSGSGAVLDPHAVNELFENVVYGDGLPIDDDDGARQRRLEAERRRLEMERRSHENALRRAQAEKDRQFFNRLILSGPDRPASRPNPGSAPSSGPQSSRPTRIQILFTAADRSRIPRKTRQQWLDKFSMAAESVFPGVLATFEPAVILSLERSVYETAKTATAYIGAWMNRIHAMKSAPSLSEFLSPSLKKDAIKDALRIAAETPPPAELPPAEDTPLPAEETPRATDDTLRPVGKVAEVELAPLPSSPATAPATRPGKPSLLGKELPFSLFGSDNEEDEVDHGPADDEQEAQDAATAQPSHCDGQELSESGPAADPLVTPVESTRQPSDDVVPEPSSVTMELVPAAKSCSEPVKPLEAHSEGISSDERQRDECLQSKKPTQTTVAGDTVDRNIIDSAECQQLKDEQSLKRNLTTADSSLEKRRKTFDPECRTFIRDVVAAHLRLRFGRDLSGKTIVSVQSRVVDKILSNPKWTLERLRKHKRDIDDFAERYAEKIRRERLSDK